VVITDLGVFRPAAESQELTLVARYENVSVDSIRAATGWPLAVAKQLEIVAAPSVEELRALRDLHERTRLAHARPAEKRHRANGS